MTRFGPSAAAFAAVLLSLAVVLGGAFAFAFADAGLATSETGLESTISSGRAGDATLDTTDGIVVVVLGETPQDR
ncbi:hypothetical protein ACFQE1_13790, partial [Halobium palmae]